MGNCGWTRCPRNSDLSHVAQDTACSWFWGFLTHAVYIQAIFSHFLGRSRDTIAELEGNKRLFAVRKARHTWPALTIFLRWSVLPGFQGPFGPKKAVLGHKMGTFRKSPPHLVPPSRGAIGTFLAENF